MDEKRKKKLELEGYRVVGNHSAVKICWWTKKAIKCEDVCYKNTFYGIQTHRCVQMTPALPFCNMHCQWCWRDSNFQGYKWAGPIDEPKDIVDGCIKEQIQILQGFKGNDKAKKCDKIEEAFKPKHFAISLVGEMTLYPKLPELIKEVHSRGMTSFLVTNGTQPSMMEKLKEEPPTQTYITLEAPNKEILKVASLPTDKDAWENIMKSLKILNEMNTRRTIRLTLVKELNMVHPEQYAQIFKKLPDIHFIELKGYMWIGHSMDRLKKQSMPYHKEIKDFANEIIKHYPELKIIDEKENSRVILLAREDPPWRIMKF